MHLQVGLLYERDVLLKRPIYHCKRGWLTVIVKESNGQHCKRDRLVINVKGIDKPSLQKGPIGHHCKWIWLAIIGKGTNWPSLQNGLIYHHYQRDQYNIIAKGVGKLLLQQGLILVYRTDCVGSKLQWSFMLIRISLYTLNLQTQNSTDIEYSIRWICLWLRYALNI